MQIATTAISQLKSHFC